jgi:hypothetical protein
MATHETFTNGPSSDRPSPSGPTVSDAEYKVGDVLWARVASSWHPRDGASAFFVALLPFTGRLFLVGAARTAWPVEGPT